MLKKALKQVLTIMEAQIAGLVSGFGDRCGLGMKCVFFDADLL